MPDADVSAAGIRPVIEPAGLPPGPPERHRYVYFPYGGGSRMCIGDRFAEMAIRLIVACLGERWKVRPDPGHEVELLPLISLEARGGLPLFLEQRHP